MVLRKHENQNVKLVSVQLLLQSLIKVKAIKSKNLLLHVLSSLGIWEEPMRDFR